MWLLYLDGIIQPETFYVDAEYGDDANTGLAEHDAFATVQTAVDTAIDGDTILVAPGTYHGPTLIEDKTINIYGTGDLPTFTARKGSAIIFAGQTEATLQNVIIEDAKNGIDIRSGSPTITNVTVVKCRFGIKAQRSATPYIANSIFWNNARDVIGTPVYFSCTQDRADGDGNISEYPQFIDLRGGNYRLSSQAGSIVTPVPEQEPSWDIDDQTSPCIDAGDPTVNPMDEPMPNGARINMGAYGATPQASKSINPWTGQIGWSEPILHEELNDGQNIAYSPSLTEDRLTIYFNRFIPELGRVCIVEARRNVPEGPFANEKILHELSSFRDTASPWISPDGMRLYYKVRGYLNDSSFHIAVAEYSEISNEWIVERVITEIHYPRYSDNSPSLSADELIILWTSDDDRPGSVNEKPDIWIATRSSINEPFSNVRNLTEVNDVLGDNGSCIMPDGLTLYFFSNQPGTSGHDIYVATRNSREDTFGDIEVLGFCQDNVAEKYPHVTDDENEVYFNTPEGVWMTFYTEAP